MATPSIRLIHLSDLHVTEGPSLEDQRADLARIMAEAEASRPHAWLLTGDLYGPDNNHKPTPAEREVLEPILVRMAETAPVVVLQGNHDHDVALRRAVDLGGLHPIEVVTDARRFTLYTEAGPVDLYGLAYPTKRWILTEADAPRGVREAQALVDERLAALFALWRSRIARRRKDAPTVPQVVIAHVQVRGSATSGGEILAGQEIEVGRPDLEALGADYVALGHLHRRQAVGVRAWYVGTPWPVDFAEARDPHGFHLVELGGGDGVEVPTVTGQMGWLPDGPDGPAHYPADGQRLAAVVRFLSTGSRRWVTLDWRWASDTEDGAPRWIEEPTAAELEAVAGAAVRARLVVPDTVATSCPWDEVLARLAALGPHRIKAERAIEPTQRVRAPTVAAAPDLRGKVVAYWDTLATPPEDLDQAAALDALQELETLDDTAITARTAALVA